MTRFVIDPGVALRLAADQAPISEAHRLFAPTLLRSQTLALLHQVIRRGEIARAVADQRLNYLRSLRIRLLGDRVVQEVALTIAAERNWPDTFNAEYVALTKLQADAFITLDPRLSKAAADLVTIAPIEALWPERT